MDVGVYQYSHGDPILIDKIVNEFLSQGKFDKLRKECMSDADTKPAYQNLQQRVENTVTQFLKKQIWRPDLNKNQLRDSLRKHILESKFFDAGINRIVDQVVNPNVLASVFLPEVEEVVYNYLSIPRPSDKIQKRDEKIKPSGGDYEYKTSQVNERFEKSGKERQEGCGDHRKENHLEDEDCKPKDTPEKKLLKDTEISNESVKIEPVDEKEKIENKTKPEPENDAELQALTPVEKMEIPSDESQESLRGMAVEGLHINEFEAPPVPDSDDSIPLEINEKSMSESRESEDSILNQMSPISQGRLTPELDEELGDEKSEEKQEKKSEEGERIEKEEEKKPLTFIGRIPKIKREDSDSSKSSKTKDDVLKKEKLNVKNIYSSDESDSSKSYGKSDSDEKKKRNDNSNKEERQREDSEKRQKEIKREISRERRKERTKDRHKDHKRERSRERHKKSSSSSSSSQREKGSGHHKSSHRHKDSKIRRKEEEKKKSKSTDDHGRERNKKEDRRSTDRDSNERERGRSSGSRTEGDSRRKEKEQSKSEENSREETNQKGEVEMEKESEVVSEIQEFQVEAAPQGEIISVKVERTGPDLKYGVDLLALDLNELFQSGALSRLEFPKVTDDFYVKFNSTGFRYFEEWEKEKLDCEEEFKEFVDEAENDLSLLSDDESDPEFEFNFDEENQKTIKNVLKGLGNFRRSLMFDPVTSEFYKWTNNKFYQKFRKKENIGEWRNTERNESDESIKENIDRGERNKALHLKLLNKYRRKAMRMGRPRRRQRRPDSWGIKEKNENQNASGKEFLNKINDTETFITSRVTKLPDCSAVGSENPTVPDTVNSLSGIYRNETVTLPESPEENEEWSDGQKVSGKEKTNSNMRNPKLSQSLPLNLPPSPDSDDVNTNSGVGPKNVTVPGEKRIGKDGEGGAPRKQIRRNYSQKYDNQDLYKPRPVLNRTSNRKRKRGLECDVISLGRTKEIVFVDVGFNEK